MGGKKGGSDLATNIKFGTRVRHVSDGALGRIVWANAVSVKIEWDDGEKVTWKRAELGIKGVAVVNDGDAAEAPATETTPASEPASVPTEEIVTAPAAAEVPAEQAPTEAGAPESEPTAEPTPESEPAVEQPADATPAKKRRSRSEWPAATGQKKVSALDAAARVLSEEHRPMGCQELIGAMAIKGYWTSPGGKTPVATLYSAILREIDTKGDASRFVKVGKGQFALRPKA
jgi:hypothetical protein